MMGLRVAMQTDADKLSRKEAAAYLESLGVKLAPGTLANMAANNNAGGGPPFTQQRWNRVWYRRGDLDAWAATQLRRVE